MDHKNNSKLKVLMQLREMVNQLIDEDFKSDKMPKLMAVKVTKVEPLKKEELPLESEDAQELESSEEMPSLGEAIEQAANPEEDKVCPMCEKSPCECESEEEPAQESESVLKLKKLLRK